MRPKLAGHWIESSLKSAVAALVLASASLAGAQTLQTLVLFNGTNGANPQAALTLGSDGNFYGTTMEEGSGDGTVFKVTPNGALTTLVSFNGANGSYPRAALTLGCDGCFYGTTMYGGGGGGIDGEVFKVTTDGTLTRLYSFKNGGDGEYPEAALTLGNDGNFYGTTWSGGMGGDGTVFKVTTNGALTTLVAFYGANGEQPNALTLGTDGNFYGTTQRGGLGAGTVFRMTTNGAWTTLADFGGNGSIPYGGLALGSDGNFYGTTWSGTVFKVTTNGALTTLADFGGTNGGYPTAGLTLGCDGSFYGTTADGGSSYVPGVNAGYGTVFRVTTNGILTTLASFNGANGAGPTTSLTLGNDGSFYGTTEEGGISNSAYPSGMGTVFRLVLPTDPPSITVQPLCRQVLLGSSASFSVAVSGTAPFRYQWRFNGTNLLNATNAAYAIQAVAATNTGSYSVVVTNAAGSATSSNAVLTVVIPPSVALQFWAGYPLLDLNGMLSSNFVVQYCTNLAGTNWINLLSLTNFQSNPYLFLDSDGVGQPARFYRAFMQ